MTIVFLSESAKIKSTAIRCCNCIIKEGYRPFRCIHERCPYSTIFIQLHYELSQKMSN